MDLDKLIKFLRKNWVFIVIILFLVPFIINSSYKENGFIYNLIITKI